VHIIVDYWKWQHGGDMGRNESVGARDREEEMRNVK
jgi:hypothetical protein